MLKYEVAHDVMDIAQDLVEKLGMDHIDLSRVVFMRSKGSRSRNTIARCHGLPKIWQKALGLRAHYIIEIISERFDDLGPEERVKVVLHELMHIPKSFGGGHRHHDWVDERRVEKFYRKYITIEDSGNQST